MEVLQKIQRVSNVVHRTFEKCTNSITDEVTGEKRPTSINERIVILCLCHFGAAQDWISINQSYAAKCCSMSRKTLSVALRVLRKNNVVLVKKENNRKMQYKLNMDYFK